MGVLRRAAEIVVVLVLSALRWVFGWLRVDGLDDPSARRAAREALDGQVIRRACESLGATFIKLGQVMSTRPDLFPAGTIAELRRLQDKLPAFPDAPARIEAALGRPIAEVFASLEPTPIAAASVAQVHRGVLHDGTVVAVKILRPDVRRDAARDGRILVEA